MRGATSLRGRAVSAIDAVDASTLPPHAIDATRLAAAAWLCEGPTSVKEDAAPIPVVEMEKCGYRGSTTADEQPSATAFCTASSVKGCQ